MNILYYGVFDGRKWRSEYPMAEGLRLLGHHLFCCNFRSRWPGAVLKAWRKYQDRIDVIFIQNGIPFEPEILSIYKKKPVVFLASEFALNSALHILSANRPPDLVLAHSEQTYQYCLQQQISAHKIHHAYNPHFYRPLEMDFKYDVCFIGGLSPKRREYLDSLKKLNLRVFVGKTGNVHKINKIYNQSKIVLHIHAQDETYLPTRLFEVMPTQGCLLIEDMQANTAPEIGIDFYRTFTNASDMVEQIQNLLKNEDERNSLVKRANALAIHHSWQSRMKEYERHFLSVL